MKKDIRKKVLTDLKLLSQTPEEKEKQENNILRQLFSSQMWQEAQTIGTTLAMEKEFNTKPLIEQALKEGKTVGVPRTFGLGKMDFYFFDFDEELELTSFGVLEPKNEKKITKDKIDLLIVPGVAFSPDGFRVGFGGGFYDRYLTDFKGKTCSLVFKEQTGYSWQPEIHDLPVEKLFMSQEEECLDEPIFK